MTQASLITDELRAAIGRESPPVTYEVDNLGCRQFARSVGYTDPVVYDEEHARSQVHRGIVAPAGFLGHPIYTPARPARGPGPTRGTRWSPSAPRRAATPRRMLAGSSTP